MLFARALLLAAFTLPLHLACGKEEAPSTPHAAEEDATCMLQVKKEIQELKTGLRTHMKSRGYAKKTKTKTKRRHYTKQKATHKKTIGGLTVTYGVAKTVEEEHDATQSIHDMCLATIALTGCGSHTLEEDAHAVLDKIVDESWTLEMLMTDAPWASKVEEIEICAMSAESAELAIANGEEVTASDLADATGTRGEDADDGGYQGDMIPGSEEQLLLFQGLAKSGRKVGAGTPWPNGHVKYCFASDVPQNIRHLIVASAAQFKRALPCMSFEDVGWRSGTSNSPESEQKCNENQAIFVMAKETSGCYSYVGYLPWMDSQQLQLHPSGCASLGTALHELGHALGMAHEQARPDRDQFVVIHWENIEAGKGHNFEVDGNGYTGVDYDYMSLMHYDSGAFSTNGQPTITKPDGGHDGIGQRSGMSIYDVEQMQEMYREVNPQCQMNGISGTGCIDEPDEDGIDFCKDISSCGGVANQKCCVCGGGIEIQCYAGEECPQRPENNFPPAPESSCINAMNYEGYGCIFENTCDFDVQFTCQSFSCDLDAGAHSGFMLMTCGGSQVTEICENPAACSVWRESPPATTSPPPPPPTTTVPPTAPPTEPPTTTVVGATTVPPPPSGWEVVEGACGIDAEGCLTSPNYPAAYGDYGYCKIMVQQPALGPVSAVGVFDVEHGYDQLTINGQHYSGSGLTMGPQDVTPTGQIEWSSDCSVTKMGWRVCPAVSDPSPPPQPPGGPDCGSPAFQECYRRCMPCLGCETPEDGTPCLDADGSRCETCESCSQFLPCLNMTEVNHPWAVVEGPCQMVEDGCITSPNYPREYGNNERCVIHVSQPALGTISAVGDFSTEAYWEKLLIDGMSFDGSTGPMHVMPHGDIVWESDGSVTRTGWKLCPDSAGGDGSEGYGYYGYYGGGYNSSAGYQGYYGYYGYYGGMGYYSNYGYYGYDGSAGYHGNYGYYGNGGHDC